MLAIASIVANILVTTIITFKHYHRLNVNNACCNQLASYYTSGHSIFHLAR